jgi:hypothetical protein
MNPEPDASAARRNLEKWELQMMDFEEGLRPIARRPVDTTQPDWLDRLRAGKPPLDEAGVRAQAEGLLGNLISIYAQGDDETRSAIRRMFVEYDSFAWAATLSIPWTSAAGFRQHLILFSMKDQEKDCRDALLLLQGMVQDASAAGVDTAEALREIASMSSCINRYGMGSTHDMLVNQYSRR